MRGSALRWRRRRKSGAGSAVLVALFNRSLFRPRLQLPVYIWVPEEEGQFQPGRCSRWWLAASLQALDADLRVRLSSTRIGTFALLACRGLQGLLPTQLLHVVAPPLTFATPSMAARQPTVPSATAHSRRRWARASWRTARQTAACCCAAWPRSWGRGRCFSTTCEPCWTAGPGWLRRWLGRLLLLSRCLFEQRWRCVAATRCGCMQWSSGRNCVSALRPLGAHVCPWSPLPLLHIPPSQLRPHLHGA